MTAFCSAGMMEGSGTTRTTTGTESGAQTGTGTGTTEMASATESDTERMVTASGMHTAETGPDMTDGRRTLCER